MTGVSQAPSASSPAPSAWPMYRAMVGVGLLCGLVIVTVFELTRPVIERKRAEALRRAVFEVLPEARTSASYRIAEGGDGGETRFVPDEGGDPTAELVHAGYDASGGLVGVAVEAEGMGYQDTIVLLYGYSPAEEAVVGIEVLESRETPGLGDRIETDPDFVANFERLDVRLDEDLAAPLHPIETVKHGEKEEPWQIDGITGATISSQAIGDILRRSTARWVPRIRRGLDDLKRSESGTGGMPGE